MKLNSKPSNLQTMPEANPDIEKITGAILPGRSYHFMTNTISVHEVLEHLLSITGPAFVYLSSFSISEAGIRCLAGLKEDGLLLKLRCLFDHTVRKNKLPMLLFAGEFGQIRLTGIHAKQILIYNERWYIVVTTSSNFNKIERYETFVITTDLKSFVLYRDAIEFIWNEAIPFEPDDD